MYNIWRESLLRLSFWDVSYLHPGDEYTNAYFVARRSDDIFPRGVKRPPTTPPALSGPLDKKNAKPVIKRSWQIYVV